MLGDRFKKEYKNIIAKFEDKNSALLSLLHEIQKENGYIKEEDVNELSELIDLPYSKIKSALSFYTMYNLKKVGKYHIQVCRNLSCHIAGSNSLMEFIFDKLKLKENEITEDGMFSLSTVECLGSCGTAPVIMINDTYHENMDLEKLERLIDELRKK